MAFGRLPTYTGRPILYGVSGLLISAVSPYGRTLEFREELAEFCLTGS